LASRLLGRRSTAWATLPALILAGCYTIYRFWQMYNDKLSAIAVSHRSVPTLNILCSTYLSLPPANSWQPLFEFRALRLYSTTWAMPLVLIHHFLSALNNISQCLYLPQFMRFCFSSTVLGIEPRSLCEPRPSLPQLICSPTEGHTGCF
jgi:hypothetical protein